MQPSSAGKQLAEKPETPIRPLPSPFYQKQLSSTETGSDPNRGQISEISSNSSDSSYHFNAYYGEKGSLAARSRSESTITPSPGGQLPNGKSPRLNGSTDSGNFTTKENGKCEYS